MKPLSKIQKDHFNRMTREELMAALADQQKQQGYIAFSSTQAADEKRAELQQRIDYIEKRLRTIKK